MLQDVAKWTISVLQHEHPSLKSTENNYEQWTKIRATLTDSYNLFQGQI